jgi:hypothetical protein
MARLRSPGLYPHRIIGRRDDHRAADRDPAAIAPAGDITAFGIYVENRRGFKLRYDNIQITAIPIRSRTDSSPPDSNPLRSERP